MRGGPQVLTECGFEAEMNQNVGAGESSQFQCRGARASVLLHEEQLREFIEVWKKAKFSGVSLPQVEDPDFASYDALMQHVLRWSRTYLIWICEKLELPEPLIEPVPGKISTDSISNYTSHLLAAWKSPLRQVPSPRFVDREYAAPWGALYCIDAMLEHAVMHPLKHRFQLEELMGVR